MSKQYFITIDTETTQDQKVADFAAVISDRQGRIFAQCAVLVNGIFTDAENHPLFFDSSAKPDALWSRAGADRRYEHYKTMVRDGSRMIASVSAINRWLERARGEFDPILTAYNLAFDVDKMEKTGIDSTIFSRRFCLWQTAAKKWGHTKDYKNFVLEKTLPMKFDSFYVSMLSEKYKTGKMNFLNGFWRGFVSNWKARSTSEYSSLIYILKKR